MTTPFRALAAASFACLLLVACRVSTNENGDKKNVDIGTPFGSMKVDTSKSGDTSAIGLTAYPGAVPVSDDSDKDSNNADVNLSFGNFHLGVKAASFQTSDSTDKVLAFYRKDLSKRYGDVIECHNDQPIGTPTRTSQGLTCQDHGRSTHLTMSTEETKKDGITISKAVTVQNNIELRSGSQGHQHIVSVDPRNGGTKIGLVLLDLPSHLSNHDNKDSE